MKSRLVFFRRGRLLFAVLALMVVGAVTVVGQSQASKIFSKGPATKTLKTSKSSQSTRSTLRNAVRRELGALLSSKRAKPSQANTGPKTTEKLKKPTPSKPRRIIQVLATDEQPAGRASVSSGIPQTLNPYHMNSTAPVFEKKARRHQVPLKIRPLILSKKKQVRQTPSSRASAEQPAPVGSRVAQKNQSKPAPPRPTAKSETLKHLERLYARDGRKMPSMSLSDLPQTAEEAKVTVQSRSLQRNNRRRPQEPSTSQDSQPVNPSPSLLQRILPFGQSSRASATKEKQFSGGRSVANTLNDRSRRPAHQKTRTESGETKRHRSPRLLPQFAKRREIPKSATDAKSNIARATPKKKTTRTGTVAGPTDDEFPKPFTELSEKEVDAQAKSRTKKQSAPGLSDGTSQRAATIAPKPSVADIVEAVNPHEDHKAKRELIALRKGMPGLKGFCPVVLRDDHELIDTNPAFSSTFELKTYLFSSSDAKGQFDKNPSKYAPSHAGADVVSLASHDEAVEGSLDHAVWYRDRLYLFSSPESLATFNRAPAKFAVKE